MSHSPKNNTCRLVTLAKTHVAHVQGCLDCGNVTVHLGPMSFRLEPSALEGLSATLAAAVLQGRAMKPKVALGPAC